MQLAQLFPSLKQHSTYPTAHNSATTIFLIRLMHAGMKSPKVK